METLSYCITIPRMYTGAFLRQLFFLLIQKDKNNSQSSHNNAHRWDLEICVSCSTFCPPVFIVVSAAVPDGASGRRCDAGSRQQPGERYRGHHQQCLPGPVGGLTHLPEGWEGPGVQPVPIQHPVLPAGLWAPGEADPPGRDSPCGETRSVNVYAPNTNEACALGRQGIGNDAMQALCSKTMMSKILLCAWLRYSC